MARTNAAASWLPDRRVRSEVARWGMGCPIRHEMEKLQAGQTHSTLGAELLLLSRGLAEARWVRSMWCEATNANYDLRKNKTDAWQLSLLYMPLPRPFQGPLLMSVVDAPVAPDESELV